MSLSCTIGYKWVTVKDCVKFEFSDIRKTILSEVVQSANDITKYIN